MRDITMIYDGKTKFKPSIVILYPINEDIMGV